MVAKKKAQDKPDPIQLWKVTAKREHYDALPHDWAHLYIGLNRTLVMRPMPNAVLPKPISVEVLGPASAMKALRKLLGDRFLCTIVSTDK